MRPQMGGLMSEGETVTITASKRFWETVVGLLAEDARAYAIMGDHTAAGRREDVIKELNITLNPQANEASEDETYFPGR